MVRRSRSAKFEEAIGDELLAQTLGRCRTRVNQRGVQFWYSEGFVCEGQEKVQGKKKEGGNRKRLRNLRSRAVVKFDQMQFRVGGRSVVMIFVAHHADPRDEIEFVIVRIREIFDAIRYTLARRNSLYIGK